MKYWMMLTFLGLSACALMERSSSSGYSFDQDAPNIDNNIYEQRRTNVETEAREELGLMGRPLGDEERQAVELRIRLKRQEARLVSKRERKQYFDVRSALKNDRERLQFLSLPTYEAKARFAQARGFGQQEESRPDDIAKLIESNDIALGMSQKAVTESWGDPDMIETAGNEMYGFERWKYNRFVSGDEGYKKELRIVYFEGGHVVGWERP